MRDCPTIDGSSIPLIIHRIAAGDCLARQSCNYHKCHRCIYRGKPANWVQPDHGVVAAAPVTATAERAVPTRAVELPRPDVAKTAASKAGDKSKGKAKDAKVPTKAAAPVAAAAKTARGKSKRQASPA